MGPSDRLKKMRVELGKTQKEMAGLIGISHRTYENYEKSLNAPGWDTCEALVKLGFNANWLLTGKGEMRLGESRHSANGNNIIQGSHIDAEDIHLSVKEPRDFIHYQHLVSAPEPGIVRVDPVMTVIKQELQRMTLDQKRAVLKLCMDITGEQYALVKNSSQSNREQRLKGILKEAPEVDDTEFEGWEW